MNYLRKLLLASFIAVIFFITGCTTAKLVDYNSTDLGITLQYKDNLQLSDSNSELLIQDSQTGSVLVVKSLTDKAFVLIKELSSNYCEEIKSTLEENSIKVKQIQLVQGECRGETNEGELRLIFITKTKQILLAYYLASDIQKQDFSKILTSISIIE